MCDLVRTLEVLYWCVAFFVGVIVLVLSPFIAQYWIKAVHLEPKTIEQALLIMGFVIALQMPIGFYSGGLMGLQTQVLLNIVNVSVSTFRAIGAVLVLWLYSPTIQAFFIWQVISSTVNICLLVFFLWKNLPSSPTSPVFKWQLFKGIWRFTVGMSGISLLGVILTQMDKIILSKLLPLEMFGYYTLASMVALSLVRLSTPIFISIYPRFTQLVSANKLDELIRLYHKSSQIIAVLTLPVAIVTALFSYEIIFLWTQNPVTAEKAHILVSILISGTACYSLMYPPYALQLAFGWTKLSIYKNLLAVTLLVPSIIYMAIHYGAIGAASIWLFLNMGYVLFEIPVMHSRLLREEKWRWYWQDVSKPLLVGVLAAAVGRLIVNPRATQLIMALELIAVFLSTITITAVSVTTTREMMSKQFSKMQFR